ncbi:MAG: hypothetical protein IJR14_06720, partial [Synergistaceae bacterium]|nr:hypothetical protein [Synergistaceae bacterium]
MTKRPFLFALALVALACLVGPALAAELGGGAGTETDPFIVRTREHLAAMHDEDISGTPWTSGKWFRLDKDIDLGGMKAPWTPIDFAGHFDGNGHAITGLYASAKDDTGDAAAGLFGIVRNGTIKRLTVHGTVSAKAKEEAVAGGIVASLSAVIEDCHFVGTVTAESEGHLTYVGGIAGIAGGPSGPITSVKDCTAFGKAAAKSANAPLEVIAGGIVGMFLGADKVKSVLTGCVADVEVSATGGLIQMTGGVAGGYMARDQQGTPYPPSENRWYGKGATVGVNVLDPITGQGVPSDEGAKKGSGAVILSHWLPEGKMGKLYDEQVIVAGNGALSISSGVLPEGLAISGTKITGVPAKTGRSTFTLKAGSSKQKFTVRVHKGNSPVDIETLELKAVAVAEEFMQQLEASGTTGKVTWSVLGALPDGVELSKEGVLSGAVTTQGTWTFTVQVVDSKGHGATQELTLTVTSGGVTPPLMEELSGPTVRWSFQPGGVLSLWLEGDWKDDVKGDAVE